MTIFFLVLSGFSQMLVEPCNAQRLIGNLFNFFFLGGGIKFLTKTQPMGRVTEQRQPAYLA